MANLNLWAKWGFAVLVIVSCAILIERLTAKKYRWSSDPEDIVEALISTSLPSSTTGADEVSILNEKFTKCLTEHSEFHYFSPPDEKLLSNNNILEAEEEIKNEIVNSSSPCLLAPGLCMHYLLIDFGKLMESLEIKLQLIEPSVLFCLLPSARKFNLLTRGFHPAKMRGLRNVMTFGITEKEARILEKAQSRLKIIESGYKIWRFLKLAEFRTRNHQPGETFSYFFKNNDIIIHLVVFYQRHTYLWYPGVNTSEINLKDVLFLENGAYDNFTTTPMSLDSPSMSQIYLPSDSRYFLLAMESSKFLECQNTLSTTNNTQTNKEQLKHQVSDALKELKKIFGSQMVSFWLWARTLHGWFENCDILHYSSDLELSIALKSVKGFNFTELFVGSACHAIKQDFNLSMDPNIELKCQDINVKISLMHEKQNVAWYTYDDQQNSYRQMFPVFEVCSTDIFGLKVNVPCDTNKIFETEFGQNWKNTSLSFNQENMKNLFIMNNSSEILH